MKLKRKGKTVERTSYRLPTIESEPLERLEDFSFWIYGPPKIGKTTLTQQWRGVIHGMAEDGAKALRLFKFDITDWEAAVAFLRLVRKTTKFDNVTLDTVEALYAHSWDYHLAKMGIEHPSDEGYGKGWDGVNKPFRQLLRGFLGLRDKGTVLVSHAVRGTRPLADGDEVEDVHPNLSGKTLELVAGMVDVIGYYHFRRGERVLQIRGDDEIMAGCRLEENFLYDDGTPVKYIPMGDGKTEAYANFLAAFNNQLAKPAERKPKAKIKKRKR